MKQRINKDHMSFHQTEELTEQRTGSRASAIFSHGSKASSPVVTPQPECLEGIMKKGEKELKNTKYKINIHEMELSADPAI